MNKPSSNKTILSLDVSTKNTGYAIISDDLKLIESGLISPNSKLSFLQNLKYQKEQLILLLNKFNPDEIVIEEPLKYMAGKSTANTLIKLNVINYTLQLAALEGAKKAPQMLHVLTIRSTIKKCYNSLPASTKLDKLAKEDVPEVVAAILDIPFPYIYKPKTKKYPVDRIDDRSYDVADSIACALAYLIKSEG